jgi:hypothetical protein
VRTINLTPVRTINLTPVRTINLTQSHNQPKPGPYQIGIVAIDDKGTKSQAGHRDGGCCTKVSPCAMLQTICFFLVAPVLKNLH